MENKKIKVLSLFDGMSCGQIALNRVGFNITEYLASEIDKYAKLITQKNYPNTKQIGNVLEVKGNDLIGVDLLIGGSPCQGFSNAGKGLNFEDPRSKLFFEFVRLLKECKPKYFLLENVRMKKEWVKIITDLLGVEPIVINSSLVSAQNRLRYYWTNIPNVQQPIDKKIVLADIVEVPYDVKVSKKGVYKKFQDKASCLTAGGNSGGNHSDMDLLGIRKDKLIHVGTVSDIKGIETIKRVYSIHGKCPTLTTCEGGHRQPKIALNDYEYRRLTPLEFERLQTVPDNYTIGVSNTQRYKMLGNGWTVDVLAHIFKNIKL